MGKSVGFVLRVVFVLSFLSAFLFLSLNPVQAYNIFNQSLHEQN